MNLFQRAHQRLPLSPEERAILKFVDLTLATAVLSGLLSVLDYFGTGERGVDWKSIGLIFLSGFSLSLYATARKWVSANGDGPMGMALQLLSEAAKRTGIAKQVEAATQPLPASSSADSSANSSAKVSSQKGSAA